MPTIEQHRKAVMYREILDVCHTQHTFESNRVGLLRVEVTPNVW